MRLNVNKLLHTLSNESFRLGIRRVSLLPIAEPVEGRQRQQGRAAAVRNDADHHAALYL